MKLVEIDKPFTVYGCQVRTNNQAENTLAHAALPMLWHDVSTEIYPETPKQEQPSLYAIYSDYQNKDAGDYLVTVGAQVRGDESAIEEIQYGQVQVITGQYLLFKRTGKLAETTVKLWIQAWEYFEQTDCPYERAYTTDIEFYEHYNPDNTEVKLYIAIK